MPIVSNRLILAMVVAALFLGGQMAHAQTNALSYWTPGWPVGFSGDSQGASTYANFPGFEFRDAGGGVGYARYNFSNGWFVGSERGGLGWSMNGSQFGAFGNSLYSEGVQFGYNFQTSGGLPVTLYAGFDTAKYRSSFGGPLAFDSMSAGTLPGYSAQAGIAIQPTSNVSLSLGFGATQQSGAGRVDSDINSPLLPGATPFAFSSGRR